MKLGILISLITSSIISLSVGLYFIIKKSKTTSSSTTGPTTTKPTHTQPTTTTPTTTTPTTTQPTTTQPTTTQPTTQPTTTQPTTTQPTTTQGQKSLPAESFQPAAAPIGTVVMWAGDINSIPEDYALCDGNTVEGYETPDLRGKFILGKKDDDKIGKTGGEEEVTLTVDQIPPHAHTYKIQWDYSSRWAGPNQPQLQPGFRNDNTSTTGGGQPHNNMPPYYVLAYIVKVKDTFMKGIISMWSGAIKDIPTGWVLCDGDNNTPDLKGKFVLGKKDNTNIGDKGGEETHTLTIEEMPSHDHSHNIARSFGDDPCGPANSFDCGQHDNVRAPNSVKIGRKGGGKPHNNMPPYYVLAYIMKT